MSQSASIGDFLIRAHQDEAFIRHLKENTSDKPYYNWILVVIYYTAMNYFCAFFKHKYPGEKLPSSHFQHIDHKSGANYPGDVEVALDKFCILGEGPVAVGTEYQQLFQWGCEVRYTAKYNFPIDHKMILEAQKFLYRIKLVTIKTVGQCAKKYKKNKIKIIPVTEGMLDNIYRQTGYAHTQ